MKRLHLQNQLKSLFEHLHQSQPSPSAVTIKVEKPWAEGKTPSIVEQCMGEGVHIDQVIRPASCEVMPRSRNQAICPGDVLLMHVTPTAQTRIEAFIGRNLEQ